MARSKAAPAYAVKQGSLLDALIQAYPRALTPEQIDEAGGKNSSARIEELRRAGWAIEAEPHAVGHRAMFRLTSKVKGTPKTILAGLTVRFDTVRGWEARTHQEALKGSVDADILREALDAALAAYKAVLDDHLPSVQTEEEDYLDFGMQLQACVRGGK